MTQKEHELRFTLLFSRQNPRHIKAAKILNEQGHRSKTAYLAEAILFYAANVHLVDGFSSPLNARNEMYMSQVLAQEKPNAPVTAEQEELDEESLAAIGSTLSQFRR